VIGGLVIRTPSRNDCCRPFGRYQKLLGEFGRFFLRRWSSVLPVNGGERRSRTADTRPNSRAVNAHRLIAIPSVPLSCPIRGQQDRADANRNENIFH
jgi:hypothetical protein